MLHVSLLIVLILVTRYQIIRQGPFGGVSFDKIREKMVHPQKKGNQKEKVSLKDGRGKSPRQLSKASILLWAIETQ